MIYEPMLRAAVFSPDRAHRYRLTREWYSDRPPFVVIGLNPSTADESQDDPTIRRCLSFARREGCGSLVMVNLFALRATDPAVMRADPAPVGIDNDAALKAAALDATLRGGIVLAAWGVHGVHLNRAAAVGRLLAPQALRCLGTTKDGHPRHPLYVKGDTPLVPYAGAATPLAGGGDETLTPGGEHG